MHGFMSYSMTYAGSLSPSTKRGAKSYGVKSLNCSRLKWRRFVRGKAKAMEILPDRTGCVHISVEIMGQHQCKLCSRLFKVIGEAIPRLQCVEAVEVPLTIDEACRAFVETVAESKTFDEPHPMLAKYGVSTAPAAATTGTTTCCPECWAEVPWQPHRDYCPTPAWLPVEPEPFKLTRRKDTDSYKLDQIRTLIPGLDDNKATRHVARALRGILES